MSIIASLTGILTGLGAFTFVYGRGTSYLTDDPSACANCHIMQREFDAWAKSSHHHVATCNDCHAPVGIFAKYAVKAVNGFNHSLAFTVGNYSEPITIKAFNLDITLERCVGCHRGLFFEDPEIEGHETTGNCVRCHGSVGHH